MVAESGGGGKSFISQALENLAWNRRHEGQQQHLPAPERIAWTPNLEVSAVCGLWGRVVNYTTVRPGKITLFVF